MAFQDRDTSESITYTKSDRPVEIRFVRVPKDGMVDLEVHVVYEVDENCGTARYTKKVPDAKVDSAWTSGTQRTLKETLLAIIDNAE